MPMLETECLEDQMLSEGESALFGIILIVSDLFIVTRAAAIEVRALFVAAVRRLKWVLEGLIPAGLTRMPIHLSS